MSHTDSALNTCEIGDNVFIGAGAVIAGGVKIEAGAMVAAGAVVPEGTVIPSNQVWAGRPARLLRELGAIERENIRERHHEYVKLSEIHSERRPR